MILSSFDDSSQNIIIFSFAFSRNLVLFARPINDWVIFKDILWKKSTGWRKLCVCATAIPEVPGPTNAFWEEKLSKQKTSKQGEEHKFEEKNQNEFNMRLKFQAVLENARSQFIILMQCIIPFPLFSAFFSEQDYGTEF